MNLSNSSIDQTGRIILDETEFLRQKILKNKLKLEKIRKNDDLYLRNIKRNLIERQLINQESIKLFKAEDYSNLITNSSKTKFDSDSEKRIENSFEIKRSRRKINPIESSKKALEEYIKSKNHKKKITIEQTIPTTTITKTETIDLEKENKKNDEVEKNKEIESSYVRIQKSNFVEFKKIMNLKNYDEKIFRCDNFSFMCESPRKKNKKKKLSPLKKKLSLIELKKEKVMPKNMTINSIKLQKNTISNLKENRSSLIFNQMNDVFLTSDFGNKLKTSPVRISYQFKNNYQDKNEDQHILKSNEKNKLIKKTIFDERFLLKIYKETPEIWEKLSLAKKNKFLPLHKYQGNLLEVLTQTLSTESIINLSIKFKEIRDLIDNNQVKIESNREFNYRLFQNIRENLENFNGDLKFKNKQALEKGTLKDIKNDAYRKSKSIAIGYKREKSLDKIKNIIPDYLMKKLKSMS